MDISEDEWKKHKKRFLEIVLLSPDEDEQFDALLVIGEKTSAHDQEVHITLQRIIDNPRTSPRIKAIAQDIIDIHNLEKNE